MYIIIVAQVIRIIGSIFGILGDRSNNPKKIYLFNSIFNLMAGIQYFLLNAITGGITSVLTLVRNVLLYKYKRKLPIIVLLIYLIITAILDLTAFDGIVSLIPILLVTVYSIGLYLDNIKIFKICTIIVCSFEIIYDFYYNAYVGIFFCVLDIILIIISFKDLKKKKKKRLKK